MGRLVWVSRFFLLLLLLLHAAHKFAKVTGLELCGLQSGTLPQIPTKESLSNADTM